MRRSTSCNYHAIWTQFNKFLMHLDYRPDDWEHRTAMFCAHLIEKGNQSVTIRSYMSTIKTVLKADQYDWDDRKIWLNSLTRACKISNDTLHCRLPIQKGFLEMILFEIPRIYPQQDYLCKLYQAIISLGYYGLMRIGELTTDSTDISDHSIKNININVALNKKKILITLYSSKTHDESNYPQQIKISASPYANCMHGQCVFCPFAVLQDYISLHSKDVTDLYTNFFIFSDGTNVSPSHVRKLLKTANCKI